ncbi:uncharacterized protein L969DRAFT_294999 [Mixia osmundae IAM 14324]|uniref:Nucleoside diphosphate kinase n=1 Tax=Mixia osmundae (strain CBS 9802 / IAM 14324 / JCM 22182 / KY 12970) TaxID=764103 RepID=G7DXD7_MIXOS|nr:uncharacterized protein L969DRAFT_294999 [Mixia osmundae IAM 14324]KEI41259.1 hypothetical protein L969DRAFT_294999 [Mixia osmundae IAM 14324]GAA95247.1 hypothetical protein E5Q_01903 [Mixia osmundae IAM 14324]
MAYELTLALIKPTLLAQQSQVTAVLREIKSAGFDIARTQRHHWTIEEAQAFYAEHDGKFYFPRLVASATQAPMMALALAAPSAITKWRQLMGPTHVYKAQWTHPTCLRARYGISDTRNAFHGSDSPQSAARELALAFEGFDTQWWLNRAKEAR